MKTLKHWIRRIPSVLFLLLLMTGLPAAASELNVHFLNVGQADATLITFADHAMLIDAGNNDDYEPILNYIQQKQGISQLDYVIGTHPHEDHIGSMDAVIDTLDVEEVLLPDVAANTKTFEDLLTSIDNKGLEITIPEPGQEYALGDASFTILGPIRDYGENLNDWSIALKLTYGTTSFLFTGDAENDAEADLIKSGLDLSADVYQAGHHGSSTSSSESFLDVVHPQYAVISCGAGNDYGHPHEETLDLFASRQITWFRTDEQGTIVASSDGETIQWNQAPCDSVSIAEEAAASPVLVHITNTGKKYHSGGCRYLKKSDIEVSLEDAKARGLTPCSQCNPPS